MDSAFIAVNCRYLSAFLVLFLLLGGAPVAVSDTSSPVVPPILSERYSRDPVFSCNTYIGEAGSENRQTVVLVHGVGAEASRIWDDTVRLLATDYHVVTFDLPGFGRSEKANTLYSPERYCEFLYWMIKENSTGPVILIGHSLGGSLVLRYGAIHPETVRQLVVIDAAAILHRIAITKNFIQFEEPEPRQQGLAGILQKPVEKTLHALNHLFDNTVENLEFSKSDEGIDSIVEHEKLRKLVLGGNPQSIASLALVQEDFTGYIAANRVPTSLLWGADDQTAPLRTGTLLAGKLPESRLRIIDKAGHVPMRDQPGEFERILLGELDSPPAGNDRPPPAGPVRTGRCERQDDLVFSGRFDEITIDGCRRVLIKNVSARSIAISRSEVTIEDTVVEGGKIALELNRAKVIGTDVRFAGETAIQSAGSRLDLAGAELEGGKAALFTPGKTVALFSVSTVESPLTKGHLHGVYRLAAGNSL